MALRWPIVLAILGGSVVLFLVGMIQTLGYNGTTSLQPVRSDEKKWTDFEKLFASKKSAPFSWDGLEPKITNSLVQFDKRLIRILSYLAQTGNSSCVWDGTHEKLSLSVDAPMYSDLIKAPYKQASVSTLYRGTGVRITSADEVKCTIKPRGAGGGIAGAIASAFGGSTCPYKVPTVFDNKPISLLSNVTVLPDKPYDIASCEVTCAVDYYPDFPTGTPDVIKPNVTIKELDDLNPSAGAPFKYEEISEKTRQAAIYKTAQLMFQIMKVDDANCEKSSANERGDRAIPITMIVPNWVMAKLGDTWVTLTDLAEQKFRFTFQTGSPLAGLAPDPNLDDKGLQINF